MTGRPWAPRWLLLDAGRGCCPFSAPPAAGLGVPSMLRGCLSEVLGLPPAGSEVGDVRGGRCCGGKCPTAPETSRQSQGWEEKGARRALGQGGDAAHSRGQSRAREQRAGQQRPPCSAVTPVLFSCSPGWPGGALPPIPQRPTGKPGETPGAQQGPPVSLGRRTGGHPHPLPVQPCPCSASLGDRGARSRQSPAPRVPVSHALVLGCPVVGSGVPRKAWESWLLSPPH